MAIFNSAQAKTDGNFLSKILSSAGNALSQPNVQQALGQTAQAIMGKYQDSTQALLGRQVEEAGTNKLYSTALAKALSGESLSSADLKGLAPEMQTQIQSALIETNKVRMTENKLLHDMAMDKTGTWEQRQRAKDTLLDRLSREGIAEKTLASNERIAGMEDATRNKAIQADIKMNNDRLNAAKAQFDQTYAAQYGSLDPLQVQQYNAYENIIRTSQDPIERAVAFKAQLELIGAPVPEYINDIVAPTTAVGKELAQKQSEFSQFDGRKFIEDFNNSAKKAQRKTIANPMSSQILP